MTLQYNADIRGGDLPDQKIDVHGIKRRKETPKMRRRKKRTKGSLSRGRASVGSYCDAVGRHWRSTGHAGAGSDGVFVPS